LTANGWHGVSGVSVQYHVVLVEASVELVHVRLQNMEESHVRAKLHHCKSAIRKSLVQLMANGVHGVSGLNVQ